MITLTRPLARQVRAVFRHALGTSPRGPCPAVSLRADQHGLTIRSTLSTRDHAGHERADRHPPAATTSPNRPSCCSVSPNASAIPCGSARTAGTWPAPCGSGFGNCCSTPPTRPSSAATKPATTCGPYSNLIPPSSRRPKRFASRHPAANRPPPPLLAPRTEGGRAAANAVLPHRARWTPN